MEIYLVVLDFNGRHICPHARDDGGRVHVRNIRALHARVARHAPPVRAADEVSHAVVKEGSSLRRAVTSNGCDGVLQLKKLTGSGNIAITLQLVGLWIDIAEVKYLIEDIICHVAVLLKLCRYLRCISGTG